MINVGKRRKRNYLKKKPKGRMPYKHQCHNLKIPGLKQRIPSSKLYERAFPFHSFYACEVSIALHMMEVYVHKH